MNFSALPTTPWHHIDEGGSALEVDVFVTTLMSQVGNALRRKVTVPYAEAFELTVPQWRVLSLIGHTGRIAFADLVLQSTSDKALVSRTLKSLEARDLVALEFEGSTPRKKMFCSLTSSGDELHGKAIAVARAAQSEALRALEPHERDVLYRALRKLQQYCQPTATRE